MRVRRLQNSYMVRQTQTGIELQKAQRIHNPLCKRLYTLKEAAEYLGRSVWGMRDLIWSQVIPVVKQYGSRKMYIDIEDLEAFIEKNKVMYN
jgi:excisionase family DNA binding protein